MKKIFNTGEIDIKDIEQFPILLKLQSKFGVKNLDSIYYAYCSARISDRLYMHDASQFAEIGVPIHSLLDRERISNGEVNFKEFHQSLEKFLNNDTSNN